MISRFLFLAGVALVAALGRGDDKPAAPNLAVAEKVADLDAGVAKHKGKVVLVDFWATWCRPCVKRFGHLVDLHKKYAEKGLVCVGVSMDEFGDDCDAREKVRKFLAEKGADFPNFLLRDKTEAGEKRLAERYGLDGAIPHLALFGRDGRKAWDSAADPKKDAEVEDLVLLELAKPEKPAELKSGPQVGSTIPGPFEPLNLNGPDAGDECCLFCKFGNSPVAMVFAAKPTDGLAKLVRELDAAAEAAGKAGAEVGVCVVVTDTSPATKKALGKLADDAKLKHVILAVIEPGKVKDYEISPDAAETVLLYSKRVVRANFAFKPGELTPKAVGEVAAETRKHFGVK